MKKTILTTLAIVGILALFSGCTRKGYNFNLGQFFSQDNNYNAPSLAYCYTPQPNTQSAKKPITVYGNFDAYGDDLYRIQVGAPAVHEKALVTMMWLQLRNFEPQRETSAQYSRVVLRYIPSYQLTSVLTIIEDMGVDKVWIQPEVPDAPPICSRCLALGLPLATCPHSAYPPEPTQIINNYYYSGNPATEPPAVYAGSAATALGPPPAPCNVSAASPGTDSVTLSWNSAGSGVCYKLYFGTRNDPSCAVAIGNLLNVAAVKINGLCSGTNYYFWVTSVRNNQESEKSVVVSVKTAAVR